MQKMITIEFNYSHSPSSVESKYATLNNYLADGWVVEKISPMGIAGTCNGMWISKTMIIISKED